MENTVTKFADLVSAIIKADLTEDQLRLLNKSVVQLIHEKQEVKNLEALKKFNLLDKVWFDAKTRGIVHGQIIKLNTKTAKVKATTGMTWNVSIGLLRKA